MKNSTITDINSLPSLPVGEGALAHAVIPQEEVSQCRINFVEVEPGGSAYGYHWHENDEEAFYVISGTGTVRTPQGEREVKAGQIITFPPCADGAHQMCNKSATEKLIYLDFGTNHAPEICHLPDIGKRMLISRAGVDMLDEK